MALDMSAAGLAHLRELLRRLDAFDRGGMPKLVPSPATARTMARESLLISTRATGCSP
jgi:hypothetical protein